MNWTRLLAAAAVGAAGYLLHMALKRTGDEGRLEPGGRRRERPRSKRPVVNYLPPERSEGFFALEHEKQLDELIVRIKEGRTYELVDESEKLGCKDYMLQLLVELLEMRDPRMMAETADTWTSFDSDGEVNVERTNERVDDTDFKESLLYVIRDNMEGDHPLMERIIRAYDAEENAYTRYRIVRAVGMIGGDQARQFLREVVAAEGPMNTFAAQVARKYLKDE